MPSYEKNKKSGLWSCRFREIGDDGLPHQRRLSDHFKTKKEAQFAYEDYIKQRDETRKQKQTLPDEPTKTPDDILFDDLLESYLSFTKNRVKESSYYDIQSKINNRLRPFFTGKRLGEITPKMVSDWIENIDYSHSSKMWIFSTLSAIYKYGDKYFDTKNIMPKVDRPRNLETPKEKEVWSPQEFAMFIQEVKKDAFAMYFRTLYVTGARRGEIAAICWKDFDPDRQTIHVSKSVTTKTTVGAYKITTPKNMNSVRFISLPRYFVDELKGYRTMQQETLKDQWCENLFMFGGSRPLPSSTVDRDFKNAIKCAGIKPITIHGLRHSCASLLLSQNISIVGVSRRLGHKNIEQTLNTYAHLMPDDQTKIINALDGLEHIV